MTKMSESNKENISISSNDKNLNDSNGINNNNKIMNKLNSNKRIRRTISFINTNRKRAANYCSLNKNKLSKNHRRLSLSQPKKLDSQSLMKDEEEFLNILKKANSNLILNSNEINESSSSFKTTKNQLVHFSNEIEKKNLNNKSENEATHHKKSSSSSFKNFVSSKYSSKINNNSNEKRSKNFVGQDLINMQAFINSDRLLKEYIDRQNNYSSSSNKINQNEELNNKIDLEIRILDGILKLLNAICSAPPSSTSLNANNSPSNLSNSLIIGSSSTIASTSSSLSLSSNLTSSIHSGNSISSILINNLEPCKFENTAKCNEIGVAIANALITNRYNNDSNSSQNSATTTSSSSSSSSSFDANSIEYNHIFQILTACKCLFVSHRKIAIYLQNLQDFEKSYKDKYLSNNNLSNSNNENENLNISTENSLYSQNCIDNNSRNKLSNKHSSSSDSINLLTARSITIDACKLMLSDLRIPLSWKWADHLKATKNSESISSRFATFAIICLENMIYDTLLISNIDPTVTDITFSEVFVFDDVEPKNFEIMIEFYSYELFNTTNNILQSARKLAKQFSDFASFKKNQTNNSLMNQIPHLFNNALTHSTNNYSCSVNKFKLIARAVLNQDDLSDKIQTKSLTLINDSNLDQINGGTINANIQNNNSNNISNNSSNTQLTNKLPLFDYYSCRLRILPTSSYI